MQTANNLLFNSQDALDGAWRNINNWQAFSIHITGVEANTWIEVSNDPSVMSDGATAILAPDAPVLSQYTPSYDIHVQGISVDTTYYVVNTLVSPTGETVASEESSLLVNAGNILSVASPARDTGGYATSWNTYISTSSGEETIQNLESGAVITPLPLGQTFNLTTWRNSQIVPPVTGTAFTPNIGINVTPPDIMTAATPTSPTNVSVPGNPLGQGYLDMTQLIYDSATNQAIWTPSCLVYNFIRVRKDATTQSLVTKAFLFGQLG